MVSCSEDDSAAACNSQGRYFEWEKELWARPGTGPHRVPGFSSVVSRENGL